MSSRCRNVFLVGMMAVGKTTVGRHLAAELELEFFDTDHVIEERAGADAAWIFDVEGEAGFRAREAQVVDELTRLDGAVLATGGGVILNPNNRLNLSHRGVVVYLESSLDRLVERTRRDRRRPLLRRGDPRATFDKLLDERGPLYASIADYRFVTDDRPPRVLAHQIAEALTRDESLDI